MKKTQSLEQKYIEKLKEFIKWFHKNTVTAEWFEVKDHDQYYKLKSEIASLESELAKSDHKLAITDADIEAHYK